MARVQFRKGETQVFCPMNAESEKPSKGRWEKEQRDKMTTAGTAVVVASALAVTKLAVGLLTASMSVLASFLDSLLDALISTLNLFSIRFAGMPADVDHGFGHEKAESLAALFQFVIVAGSALALAAVAVVRGLQGAVVHNPKEGMWVMLATTVVSLLLSVRMRVVAARTGSPALSADSMHYATDVWTNLGVVCALATVRWTGMQWVDPAVSVALAGYILYAVVAPLRDAIDVLMDRELPEEERYRIGLLIERHDPHVVGHHKLRTRRSGNRRFVEFHVLIQHHVTFQEAHDITESLMDSIRCEFPGASVIAHTDPDTAPLEDD